MKIGLKSLLATVALVLSSTAAWAGCTGDCYDRCYQAFGDSPLGYQYPACLSECNEMCLAEMTMG